MTDDYSQFTPVGGSAPTPANIPSDIKPLRGPAIQGDNDYSSFTPVSIAQPTGPRPNALQQGIMDLSDNPVVKGLVGAYQQSMTHGLFMQPVRQGMESLGVGMNHLKSVYPGQTDQWYQQHLHEMYNNAVTTSRQNADQQVAANQVQGPIARPAQQVGNFLAGMTAAPENLLMGGSGVGKTVLGRVANAGLKNSGISSLSDAAAQGMDILEGQKKDFDVTQNLTNAAGGAIIGGAMHGAFEAAPAVSDFVKGLFKNRGMDTTPSAIPPGVTSPTTGASPTLTPEDHANLKTLLHTGSVDDIKNFLATKQGPKPSYQDVQNLVQFRDSLPDQFTNHENVTSGVDAYTQDLQHQVINDHIATQTKDWKNAPQFEVIHDASDIQDQQIRQQAMSEDASGDALGFLGHDGVVRVFGSRISDPETASALIYHEGLGHFGLQEKFGDKLDSTLQTLMDRNVGQFGKRVDEWQKNNPNAYDGDRLRAAEEVLAEDSQNGQIKPSWKDAVGASVRQFGRKMGLDLSYSDGEIKHILAMSHDAVVNGNGRDVTANGFKGTQPNKFMFTGQKATGFSSTDRSSFWANDGYPRNEISDMRATLRPMENESVHKLGDVLDHPELYANYPHLRDQPLVHTDLNGPEGIYSPKTKAIFIDQNGSNKLSTVLHETQHAIQDHEQYPGMDPNASTQKLSVEDYLNHPLEKEAFETEARRDMGMASRVETPPSRFMRKSQLELSSSNTLQPPSGELARRISRTEDVPLTNVRATQEDRDWKKFNSGETNQPTVMGYGEKPFAVKTDDGLYHLFDGHHRADLAVQNGQTHMPMDIVDAKDIPNNRYMRKSQMAADTEYKAKDLEGIYKSLDENYKPTTMSFDEVRRATLDAGFKPSQIRDLANTNPGELSIRLHRLQAAANMADMKISALNDKLDTPEWSMAHQQSYIQTLADRNYLIARIKGEKSEIARALNVAKMASSYTNKTMQEVAELMKDHESGLGNLADNPGTFLKFARQVKQLMTQGNAAGAHVLMAGVNKPYWEQYLSSFHFNAMLSAMSTHVKAPLDMMTGIAHNVIDHTLAVPIGHTYNLVERLTGQTVKPGTSYSEVSARIWAPIRSVFAHEVWQNTLKAAKTGEGSVTLPSGVNIPVHASSSYGASSNPRISGASIPTDMIIAQDHFFRSNATAQELYGLGARQAIADFKAMGIHNPSFDDIMIAGAANAHNPTRSMLDQARAAADKTLLLNPNKLTGWLDKARAYKPDMTIAERFGTFAAQNLAPFMRVASNSLMTRTIERSPLPLLAPSTWRNIAAGGPEAHLTISKMMYGTIKLGLLWQAAAASKDLLTGSGPDNPSKQKELEAGGWERDAVHENGRYNTGGTLNMSINPFDVHNSTAQMVKNMRSAYEKGANQGQIGTGVKLALGSILHDFESSSWMHDVAPALGAADARGESAGQQMASWTGQEAKTFVPSLSNQINRKFVDPYQRDTRPDESADFSGEIINNMKSAVPGLSKTLPLRYSVYGDPMETGASVTGVHTAIPGLSGNGRDETTDPTKIELERLSKLMGDKALVTPVLRSVVVNGEQRKLTTKEFENYQHIAGINIVAQVRQAMSDPSWQQMSDNDKAYAVKDIQTNVKKDVRESLYGQ